jgi:6-phosphogluconolactonase (cycloisomerase 2 family)
MVFRDKSSFAEVSNPSFVKWPKPGWKALPRSLNFDAKGSLITVSDEQCSITGKFQIEDETGILDQ